jgi:RNA polymerase sigma-70 factor (ECF subfamily)
MKQELLEQKMVELLKKKDKKAIQKVYELYSPTLLATSMRYFKQRDLALDAMHEGFMKALNSIDSFNNKGSFEGWLKRVVVNHTLDTLKKEQKYQHDSIEEHHVTEEQEDVIKTIDRKDINEKKIDVNFVRDAEFSFSEILEEIHKLPEMYCLVFVLFVLEEFTHAQIAKQLGIDEKASRTRLARARKMVKEALYKRSIAVLGK